MDKADKYFRFGYLLHIPEKEIETGVGYMKRVVFDPNLAKNWVRAKVLQGRGEVTLLPHVEITKEEFDLNMDKAT
jgi:hypothetical protein